MTDDELLRLRIEVASRIVAAEVVRIGKSTAPRGRADSAVYQADQIILAAMDRAERFDFEVSALKKRLEKS